MQRKAAAILLILVLLLTGCKKTPKTEYTKYENTFYDTFNTITQVVGYTKTKQEFDDYFEKIHGRFRHLHILYDKYNTYEGVNNIKTINDNAGIQPVKVDQEIIDLILFSKEWADKTYGLTNIAFGSVLEIWHNYRMDAMYDPYSAQLPPMEVLEAAAVHTNMDNIIIDIENSTVYLDDISMRLDVGAIAKGYATEVVTQEMISEGMESFIISAGGNVRTIGKPFDGVRKLWGIGIQDPNSSIISESRSLDTIFVKDCSVVSSGDYLRNYKVGDQLVHHLIDPNTLMPGTYYRAITVITEDSGIADFLSTELFFLPFEESLRFAESLEGVEVIWVMPEGEVKYTNGLKEIMKSHGASDR
jgi:FAD:protein FMN transferase